MFLGEFPVLPPDVIRELHYRATDMEQRLSQQKWELISHGFLEGLDNF